MTAEPPFDLRWNTLDELAEIQRKRLPRVMEWASASPFYRDRLATAGAFPTAADLSGLPLTTKQDLRAGRPFGMLAVDRSRLATYHESSGTAGQATPSYYTREDWDDLVERYARKWVGITAEDTFLVRTPYALMLTGHLAHAAARSRGATVVPADNRSAATPLARTVEVIRELEVSLTWSMATETLLWAAAAETAGLDPRTDFPGLRALFVGGDPLTAARRRRISDIWGVPVVEEFGSTETGSLAGQCPAGNLHLWADRVLFEVVDPATGASSPEGSGHLVVTPLYREAMPLLRYDLEDDVEVSYAGCSCAWPLPTVRVLGRAALDHSVAGTPVTQHDLEEAVFSLPAAYGVVFWRARTGAERLTLEFEVASEHREAARAAVESAVGGRLGVPVDARPLAPRTLVPYEALTRSQDVIKPRSLFAAHEDWDRALLYY
ncbi:phenylacetate--CoA ligase family protein [Streptomonospora halophila]|uniref:Phenylacetate--CoA ligase family protein n=1 Tax=Streptomonospora halophila TaxID=427369 RepID=A0ABP9GLX5_9ACTN